MKLERELATTRVRVKLDGSVRDIDVEIVKYVLLLHGREQLCLRDGHGAPLRLEILDREVK